MKRLVGPPNKRRGPAAQSPHRGIQGPDQSQIPEQDHHHLHEEDTLGERYICVCNPSSSQGTRREVKAIQAGAFHQYWAEGKEDGARRSSHQPTLEGEWNGLLSSSLIRRISHLTGCQTMLSLSTAQGSGDYVGFALKSNDPQSIMFTVLLPGCWKGVACPFSCWRALRVMATVYQKLMTGVIRVLPPIAHTVMRPSYNAVQPAMLPRPPRFFALWQHQLLGQENLDPD